MNLQVISLQHSWKRSPSVENRKANEDESSIEETDLVLDEHTKTNNCTNNKVIQLFPHLNFNCCCCTIAATSEEKMG